MEHIKGPDFPGGGMMSREGIRLTPTKPAAARSGSAPAPTSSR